VAGQTTVKLAKAGLLDVIFNIHMNSTSANLKYGDAFIEISKGDVHAPGGSSPTVIPVPAFGVTYGINGAIKCPYSFDGKNWIQISGATSVTGWNFFGMSVKSSTCLLSEFRVGTYVGTVARQYTGGFDRVSLRTVNNQGDWRSLDDVYLTGGLAIPPAPPTITQHPGSQHICSGGTVAFTVSATGAGTVAYQWQKNNASIADGGHYSGANTPVLTVSGADSGDAGDYRCIVSNVGGSVYSDAATLTVTGASVADYDMDCDVDIDDFALFESCVSGPGVPLTPGCEDRDLDQDGDVDQTDFGRFQRCYSGANQPPTPGCDD